jgi:hypothetical protein
MRDASRSRHRKVLTFVSIVACIGASFAACAQYKRVTGESCLKDDDCLSSICGGGTCQTSPPMLPSGAGYPGGDASSNVDANPGTDAGADSSDAGGGGDSASSDSGSDGPPRDANNDVIDANTQPDADASDTDATAVADAADDVLDAAQLPDVDVPDVDADVLDTGLPDTGLPDTGLPDVGLLDANLPG